ncbi:MAG: histidine phosphatase family protein [Actinobacteria bacterium]|nr:histidine phosphatase family protein [Actinomycetota bacterium]
MKIDFQRALSAPPGAHEVILVRHGACDPPAPDGLIGGRSDPGLNERGRAEAAAAGERLRREPVAAVFASQLRRTTETAAPIAAAFELRPAVLDDLGEIYLGEWEGHGIHDRGSRGDPELARVLAEQRWDLVPGVEDIDGFGARVRRGVETVADAAGDGTVAVAVTHSAVIAEFLRQITGSEPFAFFHNTNGSLTRVIRLPDRRWILACFNDTEHVHAHRAAAGAGAAGDGGVSG